MNPEKIGRYEIKSELGRGGMATVYKAYDPRFEREVALKVLPREMMHDPQFRVRFEREAKTIALLEHPAIVPVYDVGEEDGQPYFVMRYMTDGSLAERIRQGAMSIPQAAELLSRIAPALDDAHAKGVIHRDLKPANILFDRTGEPYISDFGIAKIASGSSTVTGGAIIGTPAYMSPEQAQGEKIDGRSDVYSLGVILFEMLSGIQPYTADTPMAIVVKHITEPVPHILDKNPGLPIAIESIIEKAMAKDPNVRFGSAGEFSLALMEVARGASAQDAFKTASIAATQIQAASKTRITNKNTDKTRLSPAKGSPEQDEGRRSSPLPWILGIGGLLILGVIAVGAFVVFGGLLSSPEPTATLAPTATTAPTDAPVVVAEPTKAPAETEVPATDAPTAAPTEPAATETPLAAAVGGADKVAFIANSEIWVMNIDGSDLTQLTNDKFPKSDLQWMPDNKTVVYLTGKSINSVVAETGLPETGRVDIMATFPYIDYLEAFRISPDGKQVAISLNKELYIVPLDLEAFKNARGKSDLIEMKGCLSYTGATRTAEAAREFRWGKDNATIAWLFAGVSSSGRQEDLVHVLDISPCDPNKLRLADEFPGGRFVMDGWGSNPIIPDFDFDGEGLFVLNSFIRNNGWGDLYTYNLLLHKANKVNPFGPGSCCYRDPRWSPDGTYVFFAFQNRETGPDATTEFYYIPSTALGVVTEFEPITLPADFFTNPKEAPQPALRPAQP